SFDTTRKNTRSAGSITEFRSGEPGKAHCQKFDGNEPTVILAKYRVRQENDLIVVRDEPTVLRRDEPVSSGSNAQCFQRSGIRVVYVHLTKYFTHGQINRPVHNIGLYQQFPVWKIDREIHICGKNKKGSTECRHQNSRKNLLHPGGILSLVHDCTDAL